MKPINDREGFVPDVVFRAAVIPDRECLGVNDGAADTATGVLELSLAELTAQLR